MVGIVERWPPSFAFCSEGLSTDFADRRWSSEDSRLRRAGGERELDGDLLVDIDETESELEVDIERDRFRGKISDASSSLLRFGALASGFSSFLHLNH